MDEILSRLTQLFHSAITRFRVGSVLEPCLWMAALISLPAMLGISFTTGRVQTVFICLALAPLVWGILAYTYFMFTNPDKLRSESFEIRKQALGIIQEKGGIQLSENSVRFIANSAVPTDKLLKNGNGK